MTEPVPCPRCRGATTQGCLLCTGYLNGTLVLRMDHLGGRAGQVSAELAAAHQLLLDQSDQLTFGQVLGLRARILPP